mgnify:CR=1 FL=1
MRLIPWSAFIDLIAPSAKGAPSSAIMDAARGAAVQLCEKARVWGWTSRETVMESGLNRYAFQFEPDVPARVVGVRSLRLDGGPLQCAQRSDWPYGDDSSGRPEIWREEQPGVVVLWPVPGSAGKLLVVADLAPAHDAQACPDFLLHDYGEAIKWGALADLTNTFGQAWSNPAMSNQIFEKEFRRAVARARIREEQGGAAGATIFFNFQPLR